MIEVGVMPYKQYFKAGWREDAGAREGFSSFSIVAAVLTVWPVLLIVQKASPVRPLLRKKKMLIHSSNDEGWHCELF